MGQSSSSITENIEWTWGLCMTSEEGQEEWTDSKEIDDTVTVECIENVKASTMNKSKIEASGKNHANSKNPATSKKDIPKTKTRSEGKYHQYIEQFITNFYHLNENNHH